MKILSDLSIKLLKTVSINFLKAGTTEMFLMKSRSLKASGEGRFFRVSYFQESLKRCPGGSGRRVGCGGCFT